MNSDLQSTFETLRKNALILYPNTQNTQYEIDQFIINTLLVICKGRLCYKIDISNKSLKRFLMNNVIGLYDINIIDVHFDNEPLLYLSINKYKIDKDINPAILLNYCYTGDHWYNHKTDRYMIMPTVKINDQEIFLYTVMVPKYELDNVKNKIINTEHDFNKILYQFNYHCYTTIWSFPAKNHPICFNIFNQLF